jgi:hypothetical protein
MTMNESATERREAEVRMEIDDRRERLGETVDAIGDKVLPGRIIERRKERTTSGLRRLRERFMGSASDTSHQLSHTTHQLGDQVSGRASDAVDQVRHAPEALAHRTEGSPLAVGAVAFSLGILAAAMVKPSEPERRAAERLTDAAPDLRSSVEEVGHDIAGAVKEHASEVADGVSSSVSESASAVKAAASEGGRTTTT